jgi:hypothetical protein
MQTTRVHTRARRPAAFRLSLATTAILASVACSSSNSTSPKPNGPTGTFKGTLVGDGASGVLTLTFPSSVSALPAASRFALVRVAEAGTTIQVTGTLALTGGSSVQLTGTYNPDAEPQLVLAGGGYGLAGDYSAKNGVISGTTTFPNGKTGLWTVSANATAVKVFCGTYASSQGNGGGTWNLVLDSNNNLTGVASVAGQLQGTLSGTSLSVTYTGGTATGTLDPTSGAGNGTYDAPNIGDGDAGTWTANTGGC